MSSAAWKDVPVTGSCLSRYENPTSAGWSTNRRLAFLFHPYLLAVVPSPCLLTRQGPSSINSPRRDEPPGPPLSHKRSGSVAGSDALSKYQKKRCFGPMSNQPVY